MRDQTPLHKEGLSGRIKRDASDRSNIRSMLSTCIHPLKDIPEHSDKGVNVVTDKIYIQSNTADTVELGRNQPLRFLERSNFYRMSPKKSHPKLSALTVDNIFAKLLLQVEKSSNSKSQ